jgi:hypothetical protein
MEPPEEALPMVEEEPVELPAEQPTASPRPRLWQPPGWTQGP